MIEDGCYYCRREQRATGNLGYRCSDCRCPYCDGTGDVHRMDGERLGVCDCPAGQVFG